MIEASPSVNGDTFGQDTRRVRSWQGKLARYVKARLLEDGWLFVMVGFLLGRAIILSAVSPFAVAFLATIWLVHKGNAVKVAFAIVLGALTFSVEQGVFVALAMLVFVLLAGLFKGKQKQQRLILLFVFLSTTMPRLFLYSIAGHLTSYEWLLLGAEGVLGTVLALIFMQSIPLLSPKRYRPSLKNEEVVCMIILIASILTGTIGWEVYGASLEQILSRYFVLLMAYVGGAAVGSTVGVVAGLILSLASVANLYQMSLLAFSGLLGGLLKEGKKIGVSIGLLVGTGLVGIYGDATSLFSSLAESCVAIGLFILTPASLFKQVSRYIPGTDAYQKEQEAYLQKVRDVTAKRVEQFSDVFEALSRSFTYDGETTSEETEKRRATDYFLSGVTERSCQSCFLKNKCWQQEFDRTYTLMEQFKTELDNGNEPNYKLHRDFANHCVKSKKVIDIMKDEASFFEANQKLKKQVMESKRFVADQLQGVSDVMGRFATEILEERKQHEKQELEIVHALKQMGINLEKLDVYRLDKGNIDIEMTTSFFDYHGEGEKLIAPVLSDILDETVVVKEEEISPYPNGYCYLVFASAQEYVIETGVAGAAKGGGLVSGDSFTTMELGTGKYIMAISDGMGNGLRAHEESHETLRLLQQILQTGIPEKVAIKSINSILALRSNDEMYATLDLAVINLHNAFVRFLKIGSTPSFIKRGGDILNVQASNLPMGIIQEFDVEIVNEQLMAGDILIMMSDGIFDGPKHIENTDVWLKRKIREMKTEDPQEIADLLLEEVVRTMSGTIADDMTVMVARMDRNIPKWAAIPAYRKEA